MNEFDLENYDRAVGLADEIFMHAERIHNVFENIDELMGMLHGTHWGSTGSEDVNAQYLANIKTQNMILLLIHKLLLIFSIIKRDHSISFLFSLFNSFSKSFLLLLRIIFL